MSAPTLCSKLCTVAAPRGSARAASPGSSSFSSERARRSCSRPRSSSIATPLATSSKNTAPGDAGAAAAVCSDRASRSRAASHTACMRGQASSTWLGLGLGLGLGFRLSLARRAAPRGSTRIPRACSKSCVASWDESGAAPAAAYCPPSSPQKSRRPSLPVRKMSAAVKASSAAWSEASPSCSSGRPRQTRHQRRTAISSRGPPRRPSLQRLHCEALTCRCSLRLHCKAAAAAAAVPARCARPWLPPCRLPPSRALPALLVGRGSAGLDGARAARSRLLALGQSRAAARRLALLLGTWGPPASPGGARTCSSARDSSGLAGLLATTCLSCAMRSGGSSLAVDHRRSHHRRAAPCVGWHQNGVTRWAHGRRTVYRSHTELVAALRVEVA
eukprot:scaffold47117_cov65-Phaeocystis_antarctica.AAC.6